LKDLFEIELAVYIHCKAIAFRFRNPLSANVVHTRHDADVVCSGCSALDRQNY